MLRQKYSKSIILILFSILLIGLTGCSPSGKLLEQTDTGTYLRYDMPDKPLDYRFTSNMKQNVKAKGREFDILSDNLCRYSISCDDKTDNDFRMTVTIDTMFVNFQSPMGPVVPDMSSINGKSFVMMLTPDGHEYDLDEAEKLRYDIIPGRSISLLPTFQNVFPDLTDQSLKPGGSWTDYDTLTENSEAGYIQIIFESINTFIGYEVVDNYRCAKISASVTGEITGKSSEQGVDLVSSGKLTGTDIWYFAPKEGRLIRMESKGIGMTITTGTADEKIEIPSMREYSMTLELVK